MNSLPPNLYESREGIAKLALDLAGILSDIERSRRSGHLNRELSSPTDVAYEATAALRECIRRKILPPDELATLIEQLLGTTDESRRRNRAKFPLAKARAIKTQTGLKGRALAREMRKRGLNVSDRNVARYEKKGQLTVPQRR
jgi:hypothetical protein